MRWSMSRLLTSVSCVLPQYIVECFLLAHILTIFSNHHCQLTLEIQLRVEWCAITGRGEWHLDILKCGQHTTDVFHKDHWVAWDRQTCQAQHATHVDGIRGGSVAELANYAVHCNVEQFGGTCTLFATYALHSHDPYNSNQHQRSAPA